MMPSITCSAYSACGFFFFFQAEDGIRDLIVTGVQTCALPIYGLPTAPGDQQWEDRPRFDYSQPGSPQLPQAPSQPGLQAPTQAPATNGPPEIGRASCRERV